MKKHLLIFTILVTVFFSNAQTRIFRQLPSDNSIGFAPSELYKVEVKTCSESFKSVYTYGITPNDERVTKTEHIAMFGFKPEDGPLTIKISLLNGNDLNSSNIELVNKTYKGITTSYNNGAFLIDVCQPIKQLMVRMPGNKANPLMIHVDPYDNQDIPTGAKVVVFDGGTNGKIHEQIEQYDRYTVPNDVDVVVIEDGALFKGTIHTKSNRSTPLTVQGNGMIICRELSKPADNIKMEYNAMEIQNVKGHIVNGLTFVNGRHFAIRMSDNGHIQNVKIYGYRANNDGIVAGKNSVIENCFFKCNDDHIKLYNPNMHIRNCVMYEQENGALFQMAWNKIKPGDNCLIENIEVLEWEAGCGDPDLGQGGIARSFINHRESEENGKICANTTFKNIYIQPQIARFICLNGLDHGITYQNLTLENITLEQAPKGYNWIYANKADDNSTSIEIKFNNVRFGNRFIQQSDFKTKGTVNLSFDNNGEKYIGFLNPEEDNDCSCSGLSSPEIENKEVSIFPVPTSDYLNVSGIEQGKKVTIYNQIGCKILEKQYDRQLDISALKAGIYYLKIDNNNKAFYLIKK